MTKWIDCVFFVKGYCEKAIKKEGTVVPPCDELIGVVGWCNDKLPHSIANEENKDVS